MFPSETMIWQPEFTDKTLSVAIGLVISFIPALHEVANFSWFIGVFLSGAAYRWIAHDERVGATAGFSALAQKE